MVALAGGAALVLATAAWGQVSPVEQAAAEAVSLYYTYQGTTPSAEQLAAGKSAALVLLAEGYAAEDLSSGVVQSFQTIAGAKTAPFELIVPAFVRANFTVGGAAAIADPPPPPPEVSTPPQPVSAADDRDDDEDDEDDEDDGGNAGARVASRILLGIGVPCFASGYSLTLVAAIVAPAANGVASGPAVGLSLIPFAGPTAVWMSFLDDSGGDAEWQAFAGLVGALTFLEVFGFTFMMISAGVGASAHADLGIEAPPRRVAIRDLVVVPAVTSGGAGGALCFRW